MVVGQPRGAQEGEDFLKQQEEQHLGHCAAGWRPAQPECVGQRYREPFAGLRAARKRKVFSLPASRRQTALVLHKKVQLQPTLGGPHKSARGMSTVWCGLVLPWQKTSKVESSWGGNSEGKTC